MSVLTNNKRERQYQKQLQQRNDVGVGRSMSADDIQLSDDKLHDESLIVRSRCMSADNVDEQPLIHQPPSSTSVERTRILLLSEDWTRWMESRSTQSSSNNINSSMHMKRLSSFLGSGSDAKSGDDDSTVGYYDLADFVESNWTQAVNTIPPVGLAVLAGGFAVTHPILFMVGAITAFGTFQAAGACYDCCSDGYPCFWTREEDQDEGAEPPQRTTGLEPKSRNEKLRPTPSEITLELSDDESNRQLSPAVSAPLGVDDSRISTSTPLPASPAIRRQSESPSSLLKKRPLGWLRIYYPPLDHVAVEKAQFFGLNAVEFFNVFFANDAPFNFQEIHRQRGDKDIQYGLWERHDKEQLPQPSLHHKGRCCAELDDVSNCIRQRVLKFKAKTNSFLGPPFADTTKIQRVLMASKRLMVLESRTTVTDIPFCDRFHVMERWVVVAEKQEGNTSPRRYVSNLTVHSQVFFTISCPFESQIVSKSTSSILEISNAWCAMAKAALKLSEESRMKRLGGGDPSHDWEHLDDDASDLTEQQELSSKDDDGGNGAIDRGKEDECIEVQRLGHCRSFVLGEGDGNENAESASTLVTAKPTATQRSSISSLGSIGKMGRSLSSYVRKIAVAPRESFGQSHVLRLVKQ